MMRTKHKIITVAVLLISIGVAALLTWHVRRPVILYKTEYIPSLGGFPTAHSINDLGQVVLSRGVLSPTGVPQTRLYIWDSNNAQVDFGPLIKGYMRDLRINNTGQICGMFMTLNGYMQPFFWDPNDGLTKFGKLSKTTTRISGVNNAGQVIGYTSMQQRRSGRQSFIWDSKTGTFDLGSLGGGGTAASSINDSGQVVGVSSNPTLGRQVFLWDKSRGMSAIDGISTMKVQINNNGLLVYAKSNSSRRITEFVSWNKDTGCKTLATFVGDFGNVTSVNDIEQVLLVVHRSGFQIHKYGFFSRSDYWLWDPQRGKINLSKQVHLAGGSFRPVDINNDGWILGCIYDKKTNRPLRWLLLRPIKDKWK